MKAQDVEILLAQIKNIILNRPVNEKMKSDSEELYDLQEAISYLADCLSESNEFLKNLAMGKLETAAPSRHNFLAASLKELQSGLRHLTWQANQVANGDYAQKVSFLGEFSDSFNQMVAQLEDRENKLKNQTEALSTSMNLLVAIMDGLRDWVIVTEKGSSEVLYTNQSAQNHFCNQETNLPICGHSDCALMNHLCSYQDSSCQLHFEFSCPQNGKRLHAETFLIQWSAKMAYVHFISDVTDETVEKAELESLAFKDELTGLYNRRSGMRFLRELLTERKEFSLCMVDLDGLKAVNDRFGHCCGDEYITTVSNAMLEIERAGSMMCRVGGDEFLMIFPNCYEAEALQTVHQLEQKTGALKRAYSVSISYGIFYVSSNMALLPETILERVDEKMYIAKNYKKMQNQNAAPTQTEQFG